MSTVSFHVPGVLLAIPPCVSALRVRYEGGDGRGRIELEILNRRAGRMADDAAFDRPRLEDEALRLLDACRPGWANGRVRRGAILIDVDSGETRIETDAVG